MEQMFVMTGLGGVVLVLVAYGLLAAGKLTADTARYQWLNVIGTSALLVSLIGQWNLPAFIANTAWIAIGIFSLWRQHTRHASLRAQQSNPSSARKEGGLPRSAPRNEGDAV